MIKINLLSDRDAIRKETTRQQLSIFFLTILLFIVLAGAVQFTLYQKKRGILENIRDVENALKELKERVGEVDKYKQFKKDLEAKLAVIKDLQKNKILSVQLLDTLSVKIAERMWLEKLVTKGNEMTLEGYAIDNETIAGFMKGLEASPITTNIELRLTENKDLQGIALKHFVITTSVQPPPPGTLASDGKESPAASGGGQSEKLPLQAEGKESP
jgi:type IV pilus assembly protein PilN